MTATLLIAVVGLTDIARSGRSARMAWVLVAVVWVATAAIGVAGLAIAPAQVAAVILVAVAWMLLMPSDDRARPRRLWPVAALVIMVLVATVGFGPGGASPLESAWETLPARGVALDVALAVLAVTLFLTVTSNIVVRAALGRSAERDQGTPSARRAWELRVRGRAIAEIGERDVTDAMEPTLKGGRLIGPIERVLIVALALSGVAVLIAALVAAKGVVRFPEISEDRGVGSKAEEFLVGSLTSWTLSAAAAGYLAGVIH